MASAAEPSARHVDRCVRRSQTRASWPTTSPMALATAEMEEQPASASRNRTVWKSQCVGCTRQFITKSPWPRQMRNEHHREQASVDGVENGMPML